ncbi:unnamed protein product [Thlaspi arvense]|uniref:RRM domain-containing protein n=1 Tax=Thlaspi arvense TaxID=13288 RepID=A0AAU9T218_THLAR|nr:unnamed protein product [Thlaspi arvense]
MDRSRVFASLSRVISMGDKRKMLQESHVEGNLDPSEIQHSDALERKARRKRRKKQRNEQKKKIDELSNSLKELTETVKKLKEETALKEKVTPKGCCFESEDAAMLKHRETIFVSGFDGSLPSDEIRRSLKEHFSSCGEVSQLFLPFHCQTGIHMGYAFINMRSHDRKALTLDQSFMGKQRLLVTMADKREESICYRNHLSCSRCRRVLMERRARRFYESGWRMARAGRGGSW